jgi:AsmA protein
MTVRKRVARMPRKLLLVLGAIAGLLVLAAIALPRIVDVNDFKPRIERAVGASLQRTLRIDGDLKLAFLPRMAIELPRTSLSERGSDQEFARLESARLRVSLWPLLAGRLEISGVRINGLAMTIERRRDGSTSIDDLLGQRQASPATRPGAASPLPQFGIGGVELVDAQLTLIEDRRPQLVLSKLSLTSDALAPKARTKVALSTEFAAPQARAAGVARLAAALDLDLAANRHRAESLQVWAEGSLEDGRFEMHLASPQIEFGQAFRAGTLTLGARLSAAQAVNASVELNGVSGHAQQVGIDDLRLDAELRDGARVITTRLSGPAAMSMHTPSLRLPQFTGEARIDAPALAGRLLKATLVGSLAVDAGKQTVALKIDSRFDDTALKLDLGVAGFADPRLHFDVEADRLDIDRYVKPAPASATKAADPEPTGEPWLDLSPLRGLEFTGQARIGQLRVAGIRSSDVQAVMQAAASRLDLSPLTARLYGGTMAGSAFAAVGGNRMGLNATLSEVAIGPLLRDTLDKDLLAGTGNVRLELATAGATVADARRGLGGSAALQLRDGSIKGFDLARQLRAARERMRGGRNEALRVDPAQKTDFSELAASFTIRDGIAHNDDLQARSPLLHLTGSGDIDIGASRIDYAARVSVVGTLTGQDGRQLSELRGLTIPVRLSGPLEQMTYDIEWAGVAREALKSRLAEELLGKAGPGTDAQRGQLQDRAREALKGLLKR